jgi:hypothetical protein
VFFNCLLHIHELDSQALCSTANSSSCPSSSFVFSALLPALWQPWTRRQLGVPAIPPQQMSNHLLSRIRIDLEFSVVGPSAPMQGAFFNGHSALNKALGR